MTTKVEVNLDVLLAMYREALRVVAEDGADHNPSADSHASWKVQESLGLCWFVVRVMPQLIDLFIHHRNGPETGWFLYGLPRRSATRFETIDKALDALINEARWRLTAEEPK